MTEHKGAAYRITHRHPARDESEHHQKTHTSDLNRLNPASPAMKARRMAQEAARYGYRKGEGHD
jgi:hypothetical protein